MPPDDDEEETKEIGEEELEKVSCDVKATVYEVEPNKIPQLVYMDFKLKSGSQIVFITFLTKIMKELEMFMELPPE